MINAIYNENCLDTMRRMDSDFIDLTVTSPPYDDLRNYDGHSSFEFEKIAKELYRVTKPGGVVVWVVGDAIHKGSETLTSFKQAIYFKEECGFNVHDTMIYQKAGPRFPEKIRYSQIFEYMFVLSKGKPSHTYIIKDRPNKWAGWTNWGNNAHRVKNGEMKAVKDAKRYKKYGARFNIWKIIAGFGFGTKDKEAYKHPAMFPEQLVADHIISWSIEGGIVYDPFIGSGTTAKMAVLLNRDYIGSEINETYHKSAIKRVFDVEGSRGLLLDKFNHAEQMRIAEETEFQKEVKENEIGHEKKHKWQPNQSNLSSVVITTPASREGFFGSDETE